MEYGLFTMPSHPPERGLKEGHDWDLQVLRWADELRTLRVRANADTPADAVAQDHSVPPTRAPAHDRPMPAG